MAKVILFGLRDVAEVSHYYLTNDSEHEVVAFCVTKEFLPKEKTFKSLPIVDFDNVLTEFPPEEYCFFSPMSPIRMNTLREKIYEQIKNKGYKFISYISSRAIVNNSEIGENCFIMGGNILHPFTKIGNNVMLWSNNLIAHHSIIDDHTTLAGQVAIGGNCKIEKNSFLGINTTVRNGLTLKIGTLTSAGTVILQNTEEWCTYVGNPAKRIGKGISKSILKVRPL